MTAPVDSGTGDPQSHRICFVGGLHRSGTTPLARTLGDHPMVSPLRGTGVRNNEGQHLQHVYPAAAEHGGPGRFAVASDAHLTEESPLATEETTQQLWEAWSPYWNLKRRVLLEKSPPNILMTRFLARVFPRSSQLVIIRHPVVVALATSKWVDDGSLSDLVEHWLRAHELLREDLEHVDTAAVITYESLVRRPEETVSRVCSWLDIGEHPALDRLESERSTRYRETWSEMGAGAKAAERRALVDRFADRVAAFGYDLDDLDAEGDHGLPAP